MKAITRKFATAAAVILTLGGTMPQSHAAEIRLEGTGFYKLGTFVKYFPSGAAQSGRYKNLGSDHYHKVAYGMDWITNRSLKKTGTMSFELWAMSYYGATRGIILATHAVKPLPSAGNISNAHVDGYAIFLDTYRYPELNLWEYTSKGWRFRDALTFAKKDVL